jgi:hypothetical protein
MESKSIIWLGMAVGSALGGMVPLLWGSNLFSFSSVILTGVGGVLGIWLGFRLSNF